MATLSNLLAGAPGAGLLNSPDAEFYTLHARWRALEDEFETYPGYPDEDPRAAAMLDEADEARLAMLAQPVRTPAALLTKMETIEEGGADSLIAVQLGAQTVWDALKADLQRMAGADWAG